MIPQIAKNEVRQRVHKRIRRKLYGTPERPRLSVYRSLNHIYAQLIDDRDGKTVAAANSREGSGKPAAGTKKKTGGNVAVAKDVGKILAQRAKEKGVSKVVFDRGGYLYHGRVKALADAAREAGLKF
jgi:large subunit ribosomal protein L18